MITVPSTDRRAYQQKLDPHKESKLCPYILLNGLFLEDEHTAAEKDNCKNMQGFINDAQ